MTNILDQLKNPSLIKEIKCVDGYERFLDIELYQNDLIDNISHSLFCIDFRNANFVYLSNNTESVFGHSHFEIAGKGPMGLYSRIHPKDLELINSRIYSTFTKFIAAQEADIDLSKYRFSYTFRLKQKNGSYKMLMSKFSYLILGENGLPLMIMGTMSDVSEIYKQQELFCDIHFHQSFSTKPKKILHNVFSISESETTYNISKKEMEILSLIAKGMISKEIANFTNRSIQTIHSHRKNILKKLKCNNITDAIILAKENHWV